MAQQTSYEPHRKQRVVICSRRSLRKLDVLNVLQRHSCCPCRVDTVVRRRPHCYFGEMQRYFIAALSVNISVWCDLPAKESVKNAPNSTDAKCILLTILETVRWNLFVCAISTDLVTA